MTASGTICLTATTALLLCACQGNSPLVGTISQPQLMDIGSPCGTASESSSSFSGHSVEEVDVETSSPSCASGVCLFNHFQGRVSCPYGQTSNQAQTAPACFVAGSNEAVRTAVLPQRQDRRADAVTCSCRCAGPGSGPFCTCPNGMECVDLIASNPTLDSRNLSGSYCIAAGTAYDATLSSPVCQAPPNDCGNPRP